MKREELIRALRHMAAETGSLACLGCGYEHSCSIRGCAIIKEAIEELRKMDLPSNPPMTLEELREMDGEFVWVERSCNDWHDFCAWAFVHKKHYVCRPVAGPELFFDDYGTTWR
ncbi:MAG: hypothetical protein K2N78_04890, partial [Oscillospiraceae bacterium]|nr:hypothetical protein [Oscillospiraceae bacterium]